MLARITAEIEVQRALLRSRAGRTVAGGLASLALLTVIGLVALWPGDSAPAPGDTLVISQRS